MPGVFQTHPVEDSKEIHMTTGCFSSLLCFVYCRFVSLKGLSHVTVYNVSSLYSILFPGIHLLAILKTNVDRTIIHNNL